MFKEEEYSGNENISSLAGEIISRSAYLQAFFSPLISPSQRFSYNNWREQLHTAAFPLHQEITQAKGENYLLQYAQDIYFNKKCADARKYLDHLLSTQEG